MANSNQSTNTATIRKRRSKTTALIEQTSAGSGKPSAGVDKRSREFKLARLFTCRVFDAFMLRKSLTGRGFAAIEWNWPDTFVIVADDKGRKWRVNVVVTQTE